MAKELRVGLKPKKRAQRIGSGKSIARGRKGHKKQIVPKRDPAFLNGPITVIPALSKAEPQRKPYVEPALDSVRYAPYGMRQYILLRDDYRCRYCGVEVLDSTANIDHITPWKQAGRTQPNNLVTTCWPCNKKKGNHRLRPRSLMEHHRERTGS